LASEYRIQTEDRAIQDQLTSIQLEDLHTSGAYPKRPEVMVRGEGSHLWDAEGRKYLDLTSGQGVALLGHSHPKLVQAIQVQASKLITCHEIFYNDQRAALYERLATHLPSDLNRFFLCNSGAEAIEGAIKISRLLTERTEIIATRGGFHGRTMGALSATWNPRYRENFGPFLPDISHVPFNDIPAIEDAISSKTAAVLVEVVQGEGGVLPGGSDYLQSLRRLCDQHNAFLILDEIQTGLGRTGRWFAFQHHDVIPDILCLGKGIAGGLPMGVIAWKQSLGTLPKGSHGSTFGGNPLACAAAIATLQILEEEQLPQRSMALGEEFLYQLRDLDHPLLREVRGLGFMIGLVLRQRVTPVLKGLMARGILAIPAGPTVLRLLPPLMIERCDLEWSMTCIHETLEEIQRDR
jgi:acetylornithine/LysW-gamma-L-lysine aminotransferase